MASTLRQVLDLFDQADGALSLAQAARALDLTPEMLEGMIQHWVRKGKLRAVADSPDCARCGATSCGAAAVRLPRRYERVAGDAPSGAACCPHER